MSSGVSQTLHSSNWWFGAQVSDKNAPALFSLIVREIGKVIAGDIAEEDIAATKQYGLGRFQRSAQTVGGTASGYAGRYFFDEAVDDYERIPERINAINKDIIVDVARKMLADKIWGLGILGYCGEPFTERLRQQLEPLWQAAGE